MSIETFPGTKPDAREPAPTTEELDILVNGPAEVIKPAETAVETPATPQSRIANLLRRGADFALNTGVKLENAAGNRQARTEQNAAYDTYSDNIDATKSRERGETIDNVKETLRGFGRNALALPRRGYLEARVQLNVGRGIAGEKVDAVKDTAANVAGTVVNKVGEVKTAVNGHIESTKAQFKTEAEQALLEISTLVEQGVNTANRLAGQMNEGIEQKIAQYKAEYGKARDLVGNVMIDKANKITNYFAEHKQAALDRKEARKSAATERKQTRLDARDGRRADRAKTREINDRVVNVESMKRMEDYKAKAEARRRGRAALGTAFRVGLATAKDTYGALK